MHADYASHNNSLCFQEDHITLPPPSIPLHLILIPLGQNPERNPAHSLTHLQDFSAYFGCMLRMLFVVMATK